MRHDFNKLLTERQRLGHELKFHDVRGAKGNKEFDEDARGGKESIHRRRRETFVRRKQFNENLNPLRYFLHDNVGRPWNKIYSEITQTFDKRKVINDHILVHLFQYVEINTKIVDGKVCVLNSYRSLSHNYSYDAKTGVSTRVANEDYYDARWVPVRQDNCDWYVHPVSGCLLANKHKKTQAQQKRERELKNELAKRKVFRKINEKEELHFVDGKWLHTVKGEVVPGFWKEGVHGLSDRQFNALSKDELKQVFVIKIWVPQKTVGAVSKIASRKILRAHGLDGTNTFDEAANGSMSHRERAKYRA